MKYIAKEHNEIFHFEADNLDEALMACEIWNAVLIGKAQSYDKNRIKRTRWYVLYR